MGTLIKTFNMLEKAQVHLIDTDRAQDAIVSSSGKLWYFKGYFTQEYLKSQGKQSKYLYFTTDEKIKEGDWLLCLHTSDNLRYKDKIYKACSIKIPEEGLDTWGYINEQGQEQYIHYPHEMVKIIATTNPELWKESNQWDGCQAGLPLVNGIHKDYQVMGIMCTANRYKNGIPKIPLDFVEAYVKAQGSIKEVMLEYTTTPIDANGNVIGTNQLYPYENLVTNFTIRKELKIRSNGTVIVHPVKEDKNPNNLEVGKKYWINYLPCKSEWYQILITRFTKEGYAWGVGNNHNGIISQEYYQIEPIHFMVPPTKRILTRDDLCWAYENATDLSNKFNSFKEWCNHYYPNL